MKLGNYTVPLPRYVIESKVTYHSERKPTVFERMILRLCDPETSLTNKSGLSLLEVFRNQLGAGDVRELLEASVSELVILGALARYFGQDALTAPLTNLELTREGKQFLIDDRLPVRSRTVSIWHRYDPVSDEIRAIKNANASSSQIQTNFEGLELDLMPKNPLALVERAIEHEDYDWKNPATRVDQIISQVQSTEWGERKFEILCSEDAALSIQANHDTALQLWLDQIQPEQIWDIMLADRLKSDTKSLLPVMDSSFLRDVGAIRPVADAGKTPVKARLAILAQGVESIDLELPAIILSSDVDTPTLVNAGQQLSEMHISPPAWITAGFRSISLANTSQNSVHAVVEGKFKLNWAGQPRICDLVVTLKAPAVNELWKKLQNFLESASEAVDDPRIAFLPLAWKGPEEVMEYLWVWLSSRLDQPLESLIDSAEKARQAVHLWLPHDDPWAQAWESALENALLESLKLSAEPLTLSNLIGLITQIEEVLSHDKVRTLQKALLNNAVPLTKIEDLKQLRGALLPDVKVPKTLLTDEVCQEWVQQALHLKELSIYGPHALEHSLKNIEKAIQAIYRDIGEQALEAAEKNQMDTFGLTPGALDALRIWHEASEDFAALQAQEVTEWGALDSRVKSWQLLAKQKLAPVERGLQFIVFDTSALMENDEIFNRLRSNAIPIVPRLVPSELDGLKESQDGDSAFKARRAIRYLEEFSALIRYESEHKDLLPVEWNANEPDHSILSTALYYRLNDVLFVSNDINLRNKALSLGLKVEDSMTFTSKRKSQSSPGKKNQNKKSRK